MEVVAVVVIISVVMSLLLPALAAAKMQANAVFCLNNLKQMGYAWTLYASDNEDVLPAVSPGSFPGSGKWVSGWLDFSSNPDNTNQVYLTSADFAQVGPYVQDAPEVFRCPADSSEVRIGGRLHPRVRSISMNCWMNYTGLANIGQDRYRIFRKSTEIVDPSPQQAWVFMDEREDSINDGMFQTNLKDRRLSAKIVDFPASYHQRAAGISFADGHAMIKRWDDRRTTPALPRNQLIQLNVPSPENPDVAWLQSHSSSPLPVE